MDRRTLLKGILAAAVPLEAASASGKREAMVYADIEARLTARQYALQAGDAWRAEELRQELRAGGVEVEDRPDGQRWRRV